MRVPDSLLERDPYKFNCGGFALGNFKWFQPIPHTASEHVYQLEVSKALDIMAGAVLSRVRGLRIIDLNNYKLKRNETIILFRVAAPYPDFHFMILYNGRYLHKTGCDPLIYSESREDAENPNILWCNKYHGPIIAFAKKVNWLKYRGVNEMMATRKWWIQ